MWWCRCDSLISVLSSVWSADSGWRQTLACRLVKDMEVSIPGVNTITPEECALCVIETDLTFGQFDALGKRGLLRDPAIQSRWPLKEGFKAGLPECMWLRAGYPGVCYDPTTYVPRMLDAVWDQLIFLGDMQDAILLVRAGDGTSEGRDYPVYLEAFNLPQDPHCQRPENCFVTAMGRIVAKHESVREKA